MLRLRNWWSAISLLHATNGIGETVLHFLAVEDALAGVQWLHARGTSLNSINQFGTPLLFEVAQLGYRDLFLWLIAHGADMSQLDGSGQSMLRYLEQIEKAEMVEFIKQHLVTEIEVRFGRSPYPSGVNVTIDSDMGDYPDVRKRFHRRNWWECDGRYLRAQSGAFTFMTNEAQLYFSPAYMIAGLRDAGDADTEPESFMANLDVELLGLYSVEQLRCVIHFLEYELALQLHGGKWRREVLALARSVEQGR